jgi:hypothetical protein
LPLLKPEQNRRVWHGAYEAALSMSSTYHYQYRNLGTVTLTQSLCRSTKQGYFPVRQPRSQSPRSGDLPTQNSKQLSGPPQQRTPILVTSILPASTIVNEPSSATEPPLFLAQVTPRITPIWTDTLTTPATFANPTIALTSYALQAQARTVKSTPTAPIPLFSIVLSKQTHLSKLP